MKHSGERNSSGERLYTDGCGAKCNIRGMIRREPEWVAVRFDMMMDERELLSKQRDALLAACKMGLKAIDVLDVLVCYRHGKAPSDTLLGSLGRIDDVQSLISRAIAVCEVKP